MGSIVQCKSGKYTYLYESESYRNSDGEPRNRRKCIGKIDPNTGNPTYNAEYIDRVWGTEKQPDINDEKLFSANDIKGSRNAEFGASYLLASISQQIGLSGAVENAFPQSWEKILALAFFMVATGEPVMYCEDWLAKSEVRPCGDMSSQRISDLLGTITNAERMDFYENWGAMRREQEYFALDITSISSYSDLIGDVAWGYNRDKENLAQINVCILVGEMSRLPIFQIVYHGALKDVSTLKTTLSAASHLDMRGLAVIMDKGFGSKKNIDALLSDQDGARFLAALPFTMSFAVNQAHGEKKDIDTVDNTINVGGDVIRGVTKQRLWSAEHKLYTHIFFNAELAYRKRNALYGRVAALKQLARESPDNQKHAGEFEKYLCIRKSKRNKSGPAISVKQDAIEKELALAGWMVAGSNFITDAEEAIKIYRAKDVVEKGFLRLKNCLDFARLRVHSDNTVQNKVFIGFIALILIAHIHKVMDEHKLYRTLTMKKMIRRLETLRVQYINGKRVQYPITAEQKMIFSAFDVALPL
ncbi:MAG: transposase [Candidatus Adiutrix sp.]|jgi:transposase|nr:transposase [Candidatus Adiutrix sp.]